MADRKPTRLTSLTVAENTLCGKGANAGARVALFKRADGEIRPPVEKDVPAAPPTFAAALLERRMDEVMCDLSDCVGALRETIRATLESGVSNSGALITAALADFDEAVNQALSDWIEEAGAPAPAADPAADPATESVALSKRGAKISAERLKHLKDSHATLGRMIREQDSKYTEATMADPTKKTDDEKDVKKDEKTSDVMKALSPELREQVQKLIADGVTAGTSEMKTSLETAQKTIEATTKALDEERDKRDTAEISAMAEKDLVGFPGTVAEKVESVKAIRKSLPKEQADKIVDGMKKSAATIRSSKAFVEIGSDAPGGAAGTPTQQLDALVKQRLETVTKSGASEDYATAYAKACDSNPELYERYLNERKVPPAH